MSSNNRVVVSGNEGYNWQCNLCKQLLEGTGTAIVHFKKEHIGKSAVANITYHYSTDEAKVLGIIPS
jgi:hypothetical protein